MSKNIKIFGAKININENIFYPDYHNIIPLIGEAILNHRGITIKRRNTTWTFVDIKEILIDNDKYVTGKLCKVKLISKENRFSEEKHKLYEEEVKNIAFTSEFLLDVNNELLVFESNGEIKEEHFIENFSKLCSSIDIKIGELKIKLYPKKESIDNLIKDINKVYYAKFNIVPANFKSKNGFSKLDETLKLDKINEMNTVIKSESGEINTEEGSVFDGFMNMVKKAYGSFNITASLKNEKKKTQIGSKNLLYTMNIVKGDNDTDEELVKKFKPLIDSIKRDNYGTNEDEDEIAKDESAITSENIEDEASSDIVTNQ